MTRAIVNVATTPYYQRGQQRLRAAIREHCDNALTWMWDGAPGRGWPSHQDKPYAFKAYAMRDAENVGSDLILWCDSSILPIRSLEPLWERIERDGYWMSRNGWSNYEWTADSAYQDLFPDADSLDSARAINREIPHVVATAFGLNVRHEKGRAFLAEYYRLASETRAFCGPWNNTTDSSSGPPDVRGHRHDQTAASVIAWRLGFRLTDPPEIFAYKGGETEQTILVADGSYE